MLQCRDDDRRLSLNRRPDFAPSTIEPCPPGDQRPGCGLLGAASPQHGNSPVVSVNPARQGDDCDVVVIGGGVVGLSVAYGLAKAKLAVTILDEGDVAHRASRGNFALIWVQGKGVAMPQYARWTLASAMAWPQFASDLEGVTGHRLSFEQRGGFMACLSEGELESRTTDLQRLHNQAPDCANFERLDHVALKRYLPAIGRDVVGGTYCPMDGHVNSLRLFGALHAAALALGARYRPGAGVTVISGTSDGFRVETEQGEVRARKVVLAAGLANASLAPMVGLSAPVRPQRGQIMVTEKLARFIDYPLGSVRQTDEGGVMIGDSKEEVGFDNGNSHAVLAEIAQRAVRTFPALAQAQVVRSWGALRVMSPDGYPIYDRSASHPGAYLATCHSGVTLAAVHAGLIASSIATNEWRDDFAPFGAGRFENVPAAV
jgi:glycine/D-amino acid oxidase-like deaminating enzyme